MSIKNNDPIQVYVEGYKQWLVHCFTLLLFAMTSIQMYGQSFEADFISVTRASTDDQNSVQRGYISLSDDMQIMTIVDRDDQSMDSFAIENLATCLHTSTQLDVDELFLYNDMAWLIQMLAPQTLDWQLSKAGFTIQLLDKDEDGIFTLWINPNKEALIKSVRIKRNGNVLDRIEYLGHDEAIILDVIFDPYTLDDNLIATTLKMKTYQGEQITSRLVKLSGIKS